MELNVGQLIEEPLPVENTSLERLHEIFQKVQQHTITLDFELTRDERFTKKEWKSIFTYELLALYNWTLKRTVYSQTHTASHPEHYKNIYCFQPRYGIALHLLRRAIPFAMLGLKTYCIFSNETKDKANSILQYFIALLHLTSISIIRRNDVEGIKDSKNNLMIVTGKEETFQTIKSRFSRSRVIGSLGSAAMLIAGSYEKGKAFLKTQKKIRESCTNIRNIIVPSDKNRKLFLDPSDDNPRRLDAILDKYNPTMIHDLEGFLSKRSTNSYPYFCIHYTGDLAAQGTRLKPGMCADPKHGYPGDYLL